MSLSKKGANGLLPGPSKTGPPDLSKTGPRPRLQKIFEKNNDKKLILIIGQAAQGKSITAAAWYFQRKGRSSIWINLDHEDSDPVHLFYLLVQALHQERNEKEIKALLALPAQTFGPRDGLQRYREWASAIYETFNGPASVFFDGLDRLAPEAESFHFIQALIEKMPPAFKYILTSRGYPPPSLEFQNLKMGQQALLLINEDLAFTPEEINRYAQDCQGLTLDREQVAHIYKATEGWIGGIVMLVESLDTPSLHSLKQKVGWALPGRFQREAFQYFNQEAFKSLTPLLQDFLLRSSVFKRMAPGIIREILPEVDGESILKGLTRKNHFIQAFPDPDKGMVFRYHPLYKDFLNTLVLSKVSAAEWRGWHLQAGVCYQDKGGLEEALYHFLEAGAIQEASSLIKEIGLALIKKGQLNDLAHWLRKLPQPFIQTDPWLLLFGAIKNRFLSLRENISTLNLVVDLFKLRQDRSGCLLGIALLIEAEFTLGVYHPELIQEAEELLQVPQEDSFLCEQAFLWSQLGLVHSIRGNPRRGYLACQNAYLLGNRLTDPPLQANVLCHAITCLSILGEFRPAERLLKEMNSFSWHRQTGEIRFYQSISKIIYLIIHGEAQEALELCHPLLEEIEKNGLTYLYPLVLLHKQIALTYVQEHQEAEQISNQLSILANTANSSFLKALTSFFLAISNYWSNRRAEARQLIDLSLTLFESGHSQSELYFYGARLVRALLNDRPESPLDNIKEMHEVLKHFEFIKNHLLGTECHLALGLSYHLQGQEEQTRGHLQQAIDMAINRDYNHFMIISPQDTVRACLLAQEYLEEGNHTAEQACSLVSKKFGRQAQEELTQLSNHSSPKVRKKAWEIRRSIYRSHRALLKIETFGGLRLYLDNNPMSDKAWDRSLPHRLLLAILSQTKEEIHKEVLIDALWPDEESEGRGQNFKTTLQRLRKTLEPEVSPDFGSSYVHLHHNLVSLDKELCRVDVWHFSALYQEGRQKQKAGDGHEALDCFTQALDLYRGDFIPEESNTLLVEHRREFLKNIYLDCLTRAARYHDQNGSFKKALNCLKLAVETNPLLEEAYRSLMTLNAEKNLYNEALRVFEACRKALREKLDTNPDPVTIALYQGIKERAQKS